MIKPSALYVVATPIGNLADITLRALDVLREVSMIAAEDTRMTRRLLDHHGVAGARLVAVHEHNENRAAPTVVDALTGGQSVALVTDAGTPGISDPGARLVQAVRDAGFDVCPIPGPNAAVTAMSVSGMQAPRFMFCGFLPSKAGERANALRELAPFPCALVFYEAPHRVAETLTDMAVILGGDRHIVIAREITKLFESVHRCALRDAPGWIAGDENRRRGEFVLIVDEPAAAMSDGAEAERVLKLLLEELPVSQAAALAARITGAKKKGLYERALALKAG